MPKGLFTQIIIPSKQLNRGICRDRGINLNLFAIHDSRNSISRKSITNRLCHFEGSNLSFEFFDASVWKSDIQHIIKNFLAKVINFNKIKLIFNKKIKSPIQSMSLRTPSIQIIFVDYTNFSIFVESFKCPYIENF